MAEEQKEQSPESKGGDEKDATKQKMEELEEKPPEDLKDWPDDEAKYKTFGGPEGGHSYEEGPEKKLGPSSLRHHEDGSVSIEGEKVDDPDDYKGDPLPGGPTDPNAQAVEGERKDDDKSENSEKSEKD